MRPLHSAIPSRAIAIGLALLAHVLLFLLLVLGIHSPPRADAEPLLFVSLWPDLKPTPEPAKVNLPPPAAPSLEKTKPTVPRVAPSEGPRPAEISTAITPVPLPPIDWQREGAAAARRQTQRPPERETFSAPPKTARKPCEPAKSSFVWNPEPPRAGFTKGIPLPYVQMGKRCVIGLGFFSCNLSALPDPNSQLFDDVKEGKTMEPSVPDANVCD
jgi:hypothetical protein